MTDYSATGQKALRMYYDALPMAAVSYDDLEKYYQNQSNGYFLDGLGTGIVESGFDDSQVNESMQELADNTPDGTYPAWNNFFNYLVHRSGELTFKDWKEIAEKTASQTTVAATQALGLGLGVYFGIGLASILIVNLITRSKVRYGSR